MASIGSSGPSDVGRKVTDTSVDTSQTKTVPSSGLQGSTKTETTTETSKTVPNDPGAPKVGGDSKLEGSKSVSVGETTTRTVPNTPEDTGTVTKTTTTDTGSGTGTTSAVPEEMRVDPEFSRQTHEDVRERLGQGGKGVVDRLISTEPTDESRLAVESGERDYSGKDFPTYVAKSSISGPDGRHDLAEEAKTQKLDLGDHPRIAKGLGVTEGGEIVMEELRGGSGKDILGQLVTAYRDAPVEGRESAFRQFVDVQKSIAHMTLEGLDHMHSKGLVHNDIKPGNVAFDEDMNLKLIDFGATKPRDETAVQSTPKYHPGATADHKELVVGFGSKPWHDVFSVGRMMEDAVRQISDTPGATSGSIRDGVFSYDIPFEDVLGGLDIGDDTLKHQLLDFVELTKSGSTEFPFEGPSARQVLEHPFISSLEGDVIDGVWQPPEEVTSSLTEARLEWYRQTWEDRASTDTSGDPVSPDLTVDLGEETDPTVVNTGEETEGDPTVRLTGTQTVEGTVDTGEDTATTVLTGEDSDPTVPLQDEGDDTQSTVDLSDLEQTVPFNSDG